MSESKPDTFVCARCGKKATLDAFLERNAEGNHVTLEIAGAKVGSFAWLRTEPDRMELKGVQAVCVECCKNPLPVQTTDVRADTKWMRVEF